MTFLKRLGLSLSLCALLAAGAFTAPGCASSQALHVVTAGDTVLAQGLHLVLTAERDANTAGVPVVVKNHQAYLRAIRKADRAAITITDALIAWQQAGSNPATIPQIVVSTKADFQQMLDDLKAGGVSPQNVFYVALTAALNFLS